MSATPRTSYKTILEFRISFMCTKIISVVAEILLKNRGKQTPELQIDSSFVICVNGESLLLEGPNGRS